MQTMRTRVNNPASDALLAVFLIFLACAVTKSSCQPLPFKDPPAASLVDANNGFGIDLYQTLSSRPGNMIFSPYSISASLAMAYAGARGQTAIEMARVLHFGSLQFDVHSAFGQLNERINAAERHSGVTLLSANSLWSQKDYPFTRAYLNLIQMDYASDARTVDFRREPEAAENEINSWVAKKTDARIKKLIWSGQLSNETRLVLCNAIYFKGHWQTPFNLAATESAPFHITTNQTVTVPMMWQRGNFAVWWNRRDSVELLAMPFPGGDFSMIILLPANEPSEHRWNTKPQPALSTLEEKLTSGNLRSWLHELDANGPVEADIAVPRFTTTRTIDLSEQLKSLGMVAAFDSRADFSGMDGRTVLSISDILHKAYIQVNEEGTEAAASTEVETTLGIPPKSFIADRPFIFLIRDNATGAILFVGRIVDPTK
jgi:serine protease inhibitor